MRLGLVPCSFLEELMSAKEISLPASVDRSGSVSGAVPCAVIVGRPNVGKSSLLNCLAKQRISIVEPTAGVTRDRISVLIEHNGCLFELWDTGGIGTTDDLAEEVEYQIEMVLARADLVIFLVDAQEGLAPLDEKIARQLRRVERQVILAANKTDHTKHEESIVEFHKLGFGSAAPISALHSYGRTDLLDAIVASLPERHASVDEPVMKLAIVGRQNVGKSTLINTFAQEERVIVSEIPGTTRDAVDVRFECKGRTFVAVDTAGIRRKSKKRGAIEFYSLTRAYHAIRRCDVVLLMIDVAADISKVDKQLAAAMARECKPCVIVLNKWDLAEDRITAGDYEDYLSDALPGLGYAPASFMSALTGKNTNATLELAESLFNQARQQVPTSKLNQTLRAAATANSPQVRHGKRPKFFYVAQIAVGPPTFLIFASNPQLITEQYTRYLQNYFHLHLPFPEVPIRLIFRARSKRTPASNRD